MKMVILKPAPIVDWELVQNAEHNLNVADCCKNIVHEIVTMLARKEKNPRSLLPREARGPEHISSATEINTAVQKTENGAMLFSREIISYANIVAKKVVGCKLTILNRLKCFLNCGMIPIMELLYVWHVIKKRKHLDGLIITNGANHTRDKIAAKRLAQEVLLL